MGFALVNSDKFVILAGAYNSMAESSLQAELKTLEEALRNCVNMDLHPNHIYSDCTHVGELIHRDDLAMDWRLREHVLEIRRQIRSCSSIQLEYIPRNLNKLADKLEKFTLRNPVVSLYHKGLELPKWLVEAADAIDFKF